MRRPGRAVLADEGAVGGVSARPDTADTAEAARSGARGAARADGALRLAGLAVRERLPLWVQLRCGLEPRTLAALSVVLVVAAVLAALHFWTGRPQSVRPPETLAQGAAPSRAPVAGGVPSPAGRRVVVDVSGKVHRPGVLRLPEGARVADALTAAGGVKAGTDVTALNRARVLIDGEHVVVGALPQAAAAAPGAASGGLPAAPAAPAAPGGPVGLNTATVEQLDTLPGVGPVLARHIVEYRTRSGGFRSVDELREVDGIGERRFAELRTLVRP